MIILIQKILSNDKLGEITTKYGDTINTLQSLTDGYRSWIATHTATMKEYFPTLEGMRVRDSFKSLERGYACDKDGIVYCKGVKTEMKRDGFEYLGGGYVSDKDGIVYCKGVKTEMHRDSFKSLGRGYACDKDGIVYCKGVKTEMHRDSFESLGGGYACDKDGVYCKGVKTEMHRDSFKSLGRGYVVYNNSLLYWEEVLLGVLKPQK